MYLWLMASRRNRVVMTNQGLLDRLSFDETISGAKILKEEHPESGVTFVVTEVQTDALGAMIVPFVIPDNEDWIFTPWDWQDGRLTSDFCLDNAQDIEWRVNNTDQIGSVVNGLPRLLTGTPTESTKLASRKAFGAQLKRARQAKGLSIRGLSRLSNIHYSPLCQMERGACNPTLDTMTHLAAILDVTFTVSSK